MKLAFLFFGLIGISLQAADIKIPQQVDRLAAELVDRFDSTLTAECPADQCFSSGCQVTRFDTLDQAQDSSLPGLESLPGSNSDTGTAGIQYRLRALRCEFSFEPSLDADSVKRIKQRLSQKVSLVGVQINIVARKLSNKVAPISDTDSESTASGRYVPKTWYEAAAVEFFPFAPWIVSFLILSLVFLFTVWGWRTLGKPRPQLPALVNAEGEIDGIQALKPATPSALEIMNKTSAIRDALTQEPRLAELAIKTQIDSKNLGDLSLLLEHFGAESLTSFRDRPEYRATLIALANHYHTNPPADNPEKLWEYLERFERSIVSAKIQIDQQPLEAEFTFLESATLDELIGILHEVDEAEAVAAIAYCPRELREQFFSSANPGFTAKFVEQLTKVDKMPNAKVRQAARKLRSIYYSKADFLRTADVDKVPILEQALNALKSSERKALIAEINKDTPDLINRMAPQIFLDDVLADIDQEQLTEIFLTVDPLDAAHYLSAIDHQGVILEKMDPRLSTSIKRHQRPNMRPDPARINQAREVISQAVKEKHELGLIDLRSLNEKFIT